MTSILKTTKKIPSQPELRVWRLRGWMHLTRLALQLRDDGVDRCRSWRDKDWDPQRPSRSIMFASPSLLVPLNRITFDWPSGFSGTTSPLYFYSSREKLWLAFLFSLPADTLSGVSYADTWQLLLSSDYPDPGRRISPRASSSCSGPTARCSSGLSRNTSATSLDLSGYDVIFLLSLLSISYLPKTKFDVDFE